MLYREPCKRHGVHRKGGHKQRPPCSVVLGVILTSTITATSTSVSVLVSRLRITLISFVQVDSSKLVLFIITQTGMSFGCDKRRQPSLKHSLNTVAQNLPLRAGPLSSILIRRSTSLRRHHPTPIHHSTSAPQE